MSSTSSHNQLRSPYNLNQLGSPFNPNQLTQSEQNNVSKLTEINQQFCKAATKDNKLKILLLASILIHLNSATSLKVNNNLIRLNVATNLNILAFPSTLIWCNKGNFLMNLNQSSQSLSEFSLVSSSIPFQDYDFSDELESWDTSNYTNDELGLLQLSQRTRSNSISSTHNSLSSGSSTETVPKSTVQYTNFGSPTI